MELLSFDKILLITIFFVPGFVYLKSYRLFIAEAKTDFSKDLYEAIGFSFLNALLFSYPLYLITKKDFITNFPGYYFLAILLIVIVAPVLEAKTFHWISGTKQFSKFMIPPTISSWDFFFSKKHSYWLIITLKNGKKVGGKYGLNSHSATFPHPREIYIEDVWSIKNEGFEHSISQNKGMLITENEISTIEFYL